ncbi:Gluconate 5-dehydrogenase [Raoultella terrigena]|nr:Gluconate 5-dehydrogenase [Raoultella terrigena]
MKDLFSLQGKRILITGAGQGIGFVMAQGLAQYGAEIIINDISAPRADDAVMKLRDEGAIAHAAVFNVTDADSVEQAIGKIEEEIGAIDVLFNNAGIQRRHPFTEFPVQEWNDVISVNQTAVFLVSQAVAKRMVARQRGKIVNICSMQSELGRDTITPYAAAKGAVKMLTRGMCVELARYNVQVNGIAPGYFKTAMTQALVDDKAFTDWLCKRTPAARWGDPQELVGAAVFLSSKASDFVNGHLLFRRRRYAGCSLSKERIMAGQCIILMGVSGTGKTTVGQALAQALGAKFIDGDDLHPRQNIVKMAASQPLNDEDRGPWLERIADVIFSLEQKNESGVLVCSALKKRYRDRLREGSGSLRFLWLTGEYECILQRMQQRKGHFMPEALLRSQFAALEAPDASERDILAVDIAPDVASIVAQSLNLLEPQSLQGMPA